ncbi:hypothetical protein ACW2Q0_04865 [Nocardia sp. R16R-3T]
MDTLPAALERRLPPVEHEPMVIVDASHNVAGAEVSIAAVAAARPLFPKSRITPARTGERAPAQRHSALAP